jgi:hypothetical protein
VGDSERGVWLERTSARVGGEWARPEYILSCVSVSFRSTTLAAAVLFPVDEAALSVLAGVSCSGSAGVAELDGLEACGGIWNWLESF